MVDADEDGCGCKVARGKGAVWGRVGVVWCLPGAGGNFSGGGFGRKEGLVAGVVVASRILGGEVGRRVVLRLWRWGFNGRNMY